MRGKYRYDSFYVIGDGHAFIQFTDEGFTYTGDVLKADKFGTHSEALMNHRRIPSNLWEDYVPLLIKITVDYSE